MVLPAAGATTGAGQRLQLVVVSLLLLPMLPCCCRTCCRAAAEPARTAARLSLCCCSDWLLVLLSCAAAVLTDIKTIRGSDVEVVVPPTGRAGADIGVPWLPIHNCRRGVGDCTHGRAVGMLALSARAAPSVLTDQCSSVAAELRWEHWEPPLPPPRMQARACATAHTPTTATRLCASSDALTRAARGSWKQ